jgi:hypothetical protein
VRYAPPFVMSYIFDRTVQTMAEPAPNYGRPTETGPPRPLTDEDREDLREAFENFDLVSTAIQLH